MHETRLHYSEPLLRESLRFFFVQSLRRRLGALYFLALVVLVVLFARQISQGDRGWEVGFMAAALLCGVVLPSMVYVVHYRNSIGRFRRMSTPEGTMRCDERGMFLSSDLGSSTIPWSSITEVWRHPRFWLVFLSPGQFFTLPLEDLDEPTRDFITRHTAGAKS